MRSKVMAFLEALSMAVFTGISRKHLGGSNGNRWLPVPGIFKGERKMAGDRGEKIVTGQKVLVIHTSDNVATANEDLLPGQVLEVSVHGCKKTIEVKQSIPLGHKIALETVAPGEPIIKYGECIGLSSQMIEAGCHVHIHNVESTRARGDQERSKSVGQ